jgi:transposase-like protein
MPREHNWPKITIDLRKVYTAATLDAVEQRFEEFETTWGSLPDHSHSRWKR